MPNFPENGVLLLFAREPVPGRVKTRLAAGLGEEKAYRIYRVLLETALDAMRGQDFRFRVLAVTPDSAAAEAPRWAPGLDAYWPQGQGDLGTRLEAAFDRAFALGAGRVLAIGTDCPELDNALLEAAFSGLDRVETVLGPARDGGYYLLGLSAPNPALFREIPWGTGRVYPETTAILKSQRKSYLSLKLLSDVDTQEDWESLRHRKPLNQLGI